MNKIVLVTIRLYKTKSQAAVDCLNASQAGESRDSQTSGPELTIVSGILTDLIFKRNNGRRAVSSEPTIETREAAEFELRVSRFKIDTNVIINSNISRDLGVLEMKDKQNVSLIH
jgi:hypothetical protein